MSEPSYCTFRLGELRFALSVDHVREIIRNPTLSEVPRAPSHVRGLVNIRGTIVTAVDFHRLLTGSPPNAELTLSIVLELNRERVLVFVDEIDDVWDISDRQWTGPPSTLPGALRHVVPRVFPCEDGSLLLEMDPIRTHALSIEHNGKESAA